MLGDANAHVASQVSVTVLVEPVAGGAPEAVAVVPFVTCPVACSAVFLAVVSDAVAILTRTLPARKASIPFY